MKKTTCLMFAILMSSNVISAGLKPKKANTYFIEPSHGASVYNPVVVKFGLQGMGIAPAGLEKENTGHHHLVLDAPLPNLNQPVPKSAKYLHFGGGQTETTLNLSPGVHTLQLILGDHKHVPVKPHVISKKISITVLPNRANEN